jgi:diguanylate cyclase (GGDEF)-like protein
MLVICFITKETYRLILDVISISITICISFVAVVTTTSCKLKACHTQLTLEKMCALDPMTGINNKSTFEFRMESCIRSRPKQGYAMAICDIDEFKRVNDSYGHRRGDEVLKSFSDQLHRLADSEPDIISGRFGGDEFVLFFKRYDDQQAVVKKVSCLCSIPGFGFPVTCSVGVAFSPSGTAGFQYLFDCADNSLYRMKTGSQAGVSAVDADETGQNLAPA